MAKKILKSGLELAGIAPNILLKQVENTAPWLFEGEIDTTGEQKAYLQKLVFYKKNPAAMKSLSLTDYFFMCMAAHWTTAGTFVPTDVDNQIRMTLWKHKDVDYHMDRMGRIVCQSWLWDYTDVTNRKSYNSANAQVLSTHEGTWLSVAIGAYNALMQSGRKQLGEEVGELIMQEIIKEEKLLIQLREERDHINFLRTAPLMAHNFGDLDRVIEQWQMDPDDEFFKKIYKLGHQINPERNPILVYAGTVNKHFTSKENHRHMSMRQPRCLRRSHRFLIPIGPFMDEWGKILGLSQILTVADKAEIVAAFMEGFRRQDKALGYVRAYSSLIAQLPEGLRSLEPYLPFDLMAELKKSRFSQLATISQHEFEQQYRDELESYLCPITGIKF